jgi:hypothetical protein
MVDHLIIHIIGEYSRCQSRHQNHNRNQFLHLVPPTYMLLCKQFKSRHFLITFQFSFQICYPSRFFEVP